MKIKGSISYTTYVLHNCLSAKEIESIFNLTRRWGTATGQHAVHRKVGATQEVNLREHKAHTPPPSVSKAAHSGFETQRRHHQKSKGGVSVAS